MQITFRKLRAEEIDCRISTLSDKGLSLLLYKDARVDMRILDETLGMENWQRKHELINGNLFCSVGIRVKHEDGVSEWIWKQDVGVESYTEKEKGQASDSFKRACFNVGIGRELYTAPFIWISADKCAIQDRGGKKTCFDRFEVSQIGYDTEGNISRLVIINAKTKAVVYSMGADKITEAEGAVLTAVLGTWGDDAVTWTCKKFGVKDVMSMTPKMYLQATKNLQALKDMYDHRA